MDIIRLGGGLQDLGDGFVFVTSADVLVPLLKRS